MAVAARVARTANNNRNKKTTKVLRAAVLLRHNQLARAARLAESKGIADAIPDTLKALPSLFNDLGVMDDATLRRLYGPDVPPIRATTYVSITVQMVKDNLSAVAPLTTSHKDGWRAEHLIALPANKDCAAALIDLVGALASGDVTDDTCDLLSSATRIIILKKTEAEIAAMRAALGEAYLQPHRPPGMGGNSHNWRQCAY
jgi:hypothetical protein